MKPLIHLSFLIILLTVAGCKKDSTTRNSDLIVGQWDLKQETVKRGAETNTVTSGAKTYTYGKDGTVSVKNGGNISNSFRYAVEKDILIYIRKAPAASGHDPSTEFRENFKITKLNEHNLVITYTQKASQQVPSDYFSEQTFTR